MGVPDIQQAAKATDNFGLLKSSLEQCESLLRIMNLRVFSIRFTPVHQMKRVIEPKGVFLNVHFRYADE